MICFIFKVMEAVMDCMVMFHLLIMWLQIRYVYLYFLQLMNIYGICSCL